MSKNSFGDVMVNAFPGLGTTTVLDGRIEVRPDPLLRMATGIEAIVHTSREVPVFRMLALGVVPSTAIVVCDGTRHAIASPMMMEGGLEVSLVKAGFTPIVIDAPFNYLLRWPLRPFIWNRLITSGDIVSQRVENGWLADDDLADWILEMSCFGLCPVEDAIMVARQIGKEDPGLEVESCSEKLAEAGLVFRADEKMQAQEGGNYFLASEAGRAADATAAYPRARETLGL